MRWMAAAFLLVVTVPALADEAPDAARQAATSYLDSLAQAQLSARAAAIKAIHSRKQAEQRQTALRQKILTLIGGLPSRSAPLKAQITATHQEDGFRLENVVFESLPGYRVTADVFVPAGQGPFPAVIISPGHAPSGKASDYSFAANFARAGFVVLSYDIVGEGERLEHYDPELNASKLERPTAEHSLAAYQSLLVGEPVVRFFINDAMRGIDYLISRKDVDANRIGAFGCSGGGAVTAYTAALDPRIKAAASACFVTTMGQLLATIGPQEGEQSTPGFTAAGLDLADWVEIAAPRPYAIVSTTEDMFPFAGAREAHDEAKHFWSLFGASDKLQWITGPGRHGALAPIASDIIGFFAANLKSGGARPVFAPQRPAKPDDVLVTTTGQLSTSLGSETIQTLVKANAVAAKPAMDQKSLTELSERLVRDIRAVTRSSALPGATLPSAEIGKAEARNGYRLATIRFQPKEHPAFDAVLATPDGPIKGRLLYLDRAPLAPAHLEGLIKAGWQILAPTPAGGSGESLKATVLGDYTLFALRAMLVDRTITGLRIDQALVAADWLSQRSDGALAIYGAGTLGPVALQAALLDRRFTTVIVNHSQVAYRFSVDQPISRDLPEIALPNVLAKYDLPDVMTALAPRKVVVIDPVDQVGRSLSEDQFEKLIAATRQSDASPALKNQVQWLPYEPAALLAN